MDFSQWKTVSAGPHCFSQKARNSEKSAVTFKFECQNSKGLRNTKQKHSLLSNLPITLNCLTVRFDVHWAWQTLLCIRNIEIQFHYIWRKICRGCLWYCGILSAWPLFSICHLFASHCVSWQTATTAHVLLFSACFRKHSGDSDLSDKIWLIYTEDIFLNECKGPCYIWLVISRLILQAWSYFKG